MLRTLSVSELEARFRRGAEPASVHELHGDPVGVGIGLHHTAGPAVDRRLRALATRPGFVWRGKSFRATGDMTGWGFNRVVLGGLLAALRFDVTIGPSELDGRGAFLLSYRTDANPRWCRSMCDELREVEPGLFLGPAAMRIRGRARPLAWFAVDTTRAVTGDEI